MIKIFVCVLLLCITAWCKLRIQTKRETCDDCMPIWECNEASSYMNLTDENLEHIAKFYCGLTKTFNVCCSKLKSYHPNLKLLPDSCGYILNTYSLRIIEGTFASLYEFPWMVLISHNTAFGTEFKCSGTLINPRYVLTAAHCIENKEVAGVRVGEHDIGKVLDCEDNVCESNIQDITVEQAITHESYNRFENFINDIALLRLEQPVNMTFRNTGTICLPISKDLQDRTITNKGATVTGWGRTEYNRDSNLLLKVILPVRSAEDCRKYYGYMDNPDPKQFCAGIQNKDSCTDDSGGPLMIQGKYKGEDRYIQYGIISHGPMRCGSERPAIYTDVRKYVTWILDHMKE